MPIEPRIPTPYHTYFFSGALTEGSMEAEPGYFILWHPDEIDQNNADIQIEEYAPGFIAFGGNGGGELLVFDKEGAVFMLPMIGMEPQYAQKIAASWQDFERHIRETGKAE
jgi:hypothetical protein